MAAEPVPGRAPILPSFICFGDGHPELGRAVIATDVVSETTILIVDDSTTNREVYTALLEHFGFRVLNASDGQDGVRQARALHPDLILMDISMPVMDGVEATRLLKEDADTRGIPVIAVTAHDDVETIGRAFAAGVDGYLTKPAPPRRVLEEIQRCLGAEEDPADDGGYGSRSRGP